MTQSTKTLTMKSTEDISEALFFIDDVLDRAQCPYMVLGDVSRAIFDYGVSADVSSDKVVVGVRRACLTPEVLSVVRQYGNPKEETDKLFTFEHGGVEVQLKVIDKDYEFVKHPDSRMYRVHTFHVPNPFNAYWKVRGLI